MAEGSGGHMASNGAGEPRRSRQVRTSAQGKASSRQGARTQQPRQPRSGSDLEGTRPHRRVGGDTGTIPVIDSTGSLGRPSTYRVDKTVQMSRDEIRRVAELQEGSRVHAGSTAEMPVLDARQRRHIPDSDRPVVVETTDRRRTHQAGQRHRQAERGYGWQSEPQPARTAQRRQQPGGATRPKVQASGQSRRRAQGAATSRRAAAGEVHQRDAHPEGRGQYSTSARQVRGQAQPRTRSGQVRQARQDQRPAQTHDSPQRLRTVTASREGRQASQQPRYRAPQEQRAHPRHEAGHVAARRPIPQDVRRDGRPPRGPHDAQARQHGRRRRPRSRLPLVAVVVGIALLIVVIFAAVRCSAARTAAEQAAQQQQQEQEQQAQEQQQQKATSIAGLPEGTYYLEPATSGSETFALDVSGVGDDAYTTVVVATMDQSSGQQIKLAVSDDGSTCTLSNGELYLDVGDVTAGAGRAVFANKASGGDSQNWKIEQNDDGTYCIVSAAADYAIAVEEAYSGGQVTAEEYDATNQAQRFNIVSQRRAAELVGDASDSESSDGTVTTSTTSDGTTATGTSTSEATSDGTTSTDATGTGSTTGTTDAGSSDTTSEDSAA